MRHLVLGILFSLFATVSSAATFTITASNSGSDVVFSGSGSFDLAGLGPSANYNLVSYDRSQFNLFTGGLTGQPQLLFDTPVTFTEMSASTFVFSSVSGDPLLVQSGGFLMVDGSYNSGDAMSFLWTVEDTSVAALDLNFGTLATFGNNTVTLVRGVDSPSKVPLPASAFLLLAGLGGLAGMKRRRGA